jgi:mRNA deadenylase 3'-5' endonuclease subunit Ccr4
MSASGELAIRVVSWNVLADAYVRREYYPHTPPAILDRARRRKAVVERIAKLADADVICLQEADSALFALAEEELPDSSGRLFRKRGRGEGCAIFVRRALATDPEWRELVFSDRSGHIALGVTLNGLSIVSTHLKWEPEGTPAETHRGRVQLGEVLDAWPSEPRIVCGDFNAEPDSVLVALAKSRGLEDAYGSLPDAYTCNANEKKKRIDFIFHSRDLVATPAPLPRVEDDTALPSEIEPSDHLAIEARLHLRPPAS